MSIIFDIVKEEYSRLNEALQVYSKRAAKEIKGASRIKLVGKKKYLYIEKREGAKVVYKYIGEIHSPQAASTLESIKRRRKNEESLKKVRNDLKDVKKVLRGKI
jgi:lysozyme family protein